MVLTCEVAKLNHEMATKINLKKKKKFLSKYLFKGFFSIYIFMWVPIYIFLWDLKDTDTDTVCLSC